MSRLILFKKIIVYPENQMKRIYSGQNSWFFIIETSCTYNYHWTCQHVVYRVITIMNVVPTYVVFLQMKQSQSGHNDPILDNPCTLA
jgi:hypothetical protein